MDILIILGTVLIFWELNSQNLNAYASIQKYHTTYFVLTNLLKPHSFKI